MALTRLADSLLSSDSRFRDDDMRWVDFIRDHMHYLLATARTVTLTDDDKYRYKYRPIDYLKIVHNIEHAWIVLFINKIPSNKYFVNIDSLQIPQVEVLQELIEKYTTYVKTLEG